MNDKLVLVSWWSSHGPGDPAGPAPGLSHWLWPRHGPSHRDSFRATGSMYLTVPSDGQDCSVIEFSLGSGLSSHRD